MWFAREKLLLDTQCESNTFIGNKIAIAIVLATSNLFEWPTPKNCQTPKNTEMWPLFKWYTQLTYVPYLSHIVYNMHILLIHIQSVCPILSIKLPNNPNDPFPFGLILLNVTHTHNTYTHTYTLTNKSKRLFYFTCDAAGSLYIVKLLNWVDELINEANVTHIVIFHLIIVIQK